MGRPRRKVAGSLVFNVLNRANGREVVFHTPKDYEAFEHVLAEAQKRVARQAQKESWRKRVLTPFFFCLVLPGEDQGEDVPVEGEDGEVGVAPGALVFYRQREAVREWLLDPDDVELFGVRPLDGIRRRAGVERVHIGIEPTVDLVVIA